MNPERSLRRALACWNGADKSEGFGVRRACGAFDDPNRKLSWVIVRRLARFDSIFWKPARSLSTALLYVGTAGLVSAAQVPALDQANALESQGRFSEAALVLKLAIDQDAGPREELEFARDRLRRIKLDYPLTEPALFAALEKSVRNLSRQEYQQWVQEGRFDSRIIDGERRFMVASVSNLFFRYPALYARRLPAKNEAEVEKRHWEVCAAIKKEALALQQPYVLPKRFQITMTISADAGAAPAGQTIRAWIPIPRSNPFQDQFEMIRSSAPLKHLDNESSTARSAYFEETAQNAKPTEFKIQYEYTARGVWFAIDPQRVQPCDTNDPRLNPFTQESPHVQFTPSIRRLAEQIAPGERNPYVKGKKFYDWISDHIQYSFALEYSTVPNLSEYCRAHGYGDCGQEAFLFITLCRLSGIPARWQSGWNIFPGATSNHDWTEIYLAPYGWVPVDPYMGIYATRYAFTLTAEQRRDIRDFYFGGLDQYRMSANSDHNQPLSPPKTAMRSDNVDFQRGELEWGEHNIYFDRFSYDLTAREVRSTSTKLE